MQPQEVVQVVKSIRQCKSVIFIPHLQSGLPAFTQSLSPANCPLQSLIQSFIHSESQPLIFRVDIVRRLVRAFNNNFQFNLWHFFLIFIFKYIFYFLVKRLDKWLKTKSKNRSKAQSKSTKHSPKTVCIAQRLSLCK